MTTPSTEREIRRRRRYAPSFKAKIVAACLQGDASIAQVALQHGLNTNLVQTWIRKAKRQSQLPAVPDFVPLPVPPAAGDLPAPTTIAGEIRIELPSARGTITVHWPITEAAQCVQWLKGLL
ncbi:IS66-like element accessory protein TnpA [Halomonas sp. M4R1S46]|uniref:IS66-like element accessory protein TnpA n=1 Tax=Halomonas sp. M4R1S46 TaxID=2982692 RepID=UPI0021E36A23|nr:transposase [Halomonas sp. M4R1S46]UYG08020.1 transposase [Halomonas sp. M4R1S46]UYG08635.1 transposase [Halomonas sp. M4R1S46]